MHATQQKAVSTKLVVGKEYHLKLSPTGQLDIRGPIEPGSKDDMD